MLFQTNIEDIMNDKTSLELSNLYIKYNYIHKVDIIETKDGYEIIITTDVLSKKETCHILMNSQKQYLSSTCSCDWNSNNGPCPHVGAALLWLNKHDIDVISFHYVNRSHLKIEEEKKNKLLMKLSKPTKEYIDEKRNSNDSYDDITYDGPQYQLEPKLKESLNNLFAIEYLVGNEDQYHINDLNKFIWRIDNKVNSSYGYFLKFKHCEQAFDSFALKQIEFIRKAKLYYDNIEARKSYRDNRVYTLRKQITVNLNLIDDFFETYYNEDEKQIFDTFKCINENNLVSLSLLDKYEFYILHLESKYKIKSLKHCYEIEKDHSNFFTITRNQFDEEGNVCELIKKLEKEDLFILREDYDDFYKYILLPIIDYLDIQLPQNVLCDQYKTIKIYGTIDDIHDSLVFEVYYINDNNDHIKGLNPNNRLNHNQTIVEEYIKEYASWIDIEKQKAHFSFDKEKTNDFINKILPILQEYAEINVTKDLKKFDEKSHLDINAGIKIVNNLLQIDLDCNQISKDEIKDILLYYNRGRKYYRLKNGENINLNSPELKELSDFLRLYNINSNDIEDGSISLPSTRMFSINDDIDKFEHIHIDKKESFKNTINNFFDNGINNHQIPNRYQNVLRDYQKDGYQWLHMLRDYNFNGLLADDMGLGKTLEVIALLDSLGDCTSLVVCPASLVYNWEDEVYKFSNNFKVKCVSGDQYERKNIINHYNRYQLLVTSYDYMRRDYDLYKRINFEYVILDEAQNIKNHNSQKAKSVKKIKSKT
ncbi:MAG: SNF2 helicase associated domain-containing protein [Erysipelotrichaceae bacterium]|nr:SNF2 helicase associated domain-containing protein [Erysipelotrichaceae bacterium]